MTKRYEWRELSEDGLLRKPKDVSINGWHGTKSLNEYGGFENEEKAIAALKNFKSEYEWEWKCSEDLVLVTFYTP